MEAGSFSDKAQGQQLNMKTIGKMLSIDKNGDGEINLVTEVFRPNETDMTVFEKNMKTIMVTLRSRQVRTSSVYFFPKYIPSSRQYVGKLKTHLNLSDWMIEASQNLQVVHYEPGEHYGAHRDGLGRVITIFSYLNNVETGGETAFPFANVPITRNNIQNVTLTKECSATFNCR